MDVEWDPAGVKKLLKFVPLAARKLPSFPASNPLADRSARVRQTRGYKPVAVFPGCAGLREALSLGVPCSYIFDMF